MDNLGGAAYTVRADTSQFNKGIDESEKKLQELIGQFKQADVALGKLEATSKSFGSVAASTATQTEKLGHHGRGAAQGMLQLGYAIDDLQYGLGAVVNNIPQLIYMMGGNAGLAGAVGILAVGANIAYKNWDGLKGSLGQTAPIQAATGAMVEFQEAVKQAHEHPGQGMLGRTVLEDVHDLQEWWGNATEAAKQHAIAVKEVEDALKKVAGVTGTAAGSRGSDFTRDVADYGGGDKLLKDTFEKQAIARGMTDPKAREALRDSIAKEIAKGMAGEDVNMEMFPGLGAPAQKRLELQGGRNDRQRVQKMEADAKKQGEAEKKEWLDGVGKEQKLLDAKRKQDNINALEDERTAMQERHHQEDLTLEAMRQRLGSGSQTLQGAKGIVDFYQKASADSPLIQLAKETKRIQEDQRTELKEINAKLEKERRVRPA